MSLHENIKKLRTDKGMSQRELARQINMSGQMISKIEKAETTPSLEAITKIAAALNVEISDLIGQPITISYDEKEHLIEQLMNKLGYQIIDDIEEGYLGVKYKNAEYEIEQSDLDKIYYSSTSFLEFQLQELLKHSRKIGHKEGE